MNSEKMPKFFYKYGNQIHIVLPKHKTHPLKILIKLLDESNVNWDAITEKEKNILMVFLKKYTDLIK